MNSQSTIAEAAETGRTDYRDGGVLSAAALTGDSVANVAAWEKHQSEAHLQGIVAGLFVEPIGNVVNVGPGAAIDSHARMLLVDHDLTLDISKEDGEWLSLWLRLVVEKVAAPESDLQRYRQTSRLEVSPKNDLRDAGESVASGGVLLAYVQRDTTNGSVLKIDSCCRRYVGAVGNRIDAPSGRAQIVLGPQFPRDPRRFAIGVQAAASQPIRDVFAWESSGTIRLTARTAVALPHQKEETDEIEQPPLMIVGSPSVNVAPDDILNPCQVRNLLLGEGGRLFRILEMLPEFDWHGLEETKCVNSLNRQVLQSLNRLIQRAEDYVSALPDPTYGPSWIDWLISIVPENLPEFYWRRKRMPIGGLLTGSYLCRVALDHFLGDAIKPLENRAPRGLYFNGTVPMEHEPSPSRIHLVEFKKDGQTFRQLRITIPDPGKENSPHRYRCSIGTALGCTHGPAPTPTEKSWNQQTSWPRGIFSVLADKSIDIHNQLNVYPSDGAILPGLILKLEPESDPGSGASGGTEGRSQPPATQILANAVVWEGQRVQRRIPTEIIINGSLHNLTDQAIESLQVRASVYGKGDTDHPPSHKEIVSQTSLAAKSSMPVQTLAAQGSLIVEIPAVFHAKIVVVNLLVMGVNSQNAIICTQYTEELTVPLDPPNP